MKALPPTETLCREASERTAKWAAQAIQRTRRSGPHFTVLSWYKGLTCFAAAGDLESGTALLQRFEKTGSRRGDFHPLNEMTVARALTPPWSCETWSNAFASALHAPLDLWRNYRNAWIAYGAQRLGAGQMSAPTLDLLAATMSSARAVPHNDLLDPSQRYYDVGTAASVAHAMLGAERIEDALRLGEFMRDVIMRQGADAPRVYLAEDARGHALSVPENALIHRQFWLEVGAPGQGYWIVGFALKVFALLFKATGDSRWLDPAARILAWLERSHSDSVASITCAKLAWGAAEMFVVTGDKAWHGIAAKSIGYVAHSQSPDGRWIRPDYPWWLPQPLLATLDTSVERSFYLREVPRCLREGGMPLAA